MIAGHPVLGAVTYKALGDRPVWLKWLLVIPAGFVTHWILDSVISYHSYSFNCWYDCLIVGVNIGSMILLAFFLLRNKGWSGMWNLLAAIWFWIVWDWDHIFGGMFLHKTDHAILARYFATQSPDPWSVVLELCFVWKRLTRGVIDS